MTFIVEKKEGCNGQPRLVPGKPTPLYQCNDCGTISLHPQSFPHSYVAISPIKEPEDV